MKEENYPFIWSDNWCIEDDKAWFVDGEKNSLFCVDITLKQCEYIKEIPVKETGRFRLNPKCLKIDNYIFCMPDIGDNLWIFSLEDFQFQKIEITNPDKVRIGIRDFWQNGERIYAVSTGLKQVMEISIKEKKVEGYYNLCNREDCQISRSVRIGEKIFSTSAISNHIYEFDIETKVVEEYIIPNIEDGFQTICFDGEDFWLSGYQKAIYVWNRKKNTVIVINEFPLSFGIYNFKGTEEDLLDCNAVKYDTPCFLEALALGEYIWYIPFQTNKIIYVDRDTYEVFSFEMAEENESPNSLMKRDLYHKYLLQYSIEERYLGLFSLKNNCILEIDTKKRKVRKDIYTFRADSLKKVISDHILREQIAFERMAFRIIFKSGQEEMAIEKPRSIGENIQKKCCEM